MPNYTPYTYPHPLVTGSSNVLRPTLSALVAPAGPVWLVGVTGTRAIIGVSLRKLTPYRISICNAQGPRLWEAEAGMLERTVDWQFGANGNGVYMVKVTSAKETLSARFVAMR